MTSPWEKEREREWYFALVHSNNVGDDGFWKNFHSFLKPSRFILKFTVYMSIYINWFDEKAKLLEQ